MRDWFDLDEALGADASVTFSSDTATVVSVQQALKARGYDPGPVNGVYGLQTIAAIKKLQAANKLPQTGNVDTDVLFLLGVATPSFALSSSSFSLPPVYSGKVGAPAGATPKPDEILTYGPPLPAGFGAPRSVAVVKTPFLSRDVGGGLKMWQAGTIGLVGLALLGGVVAFAVKK